MEILIYDLPKNELQEEKKERREWHRTLTDPHLFDIKYQ